MAILLLDRNVWNFPYARLPVIISVQVLPWAAGAASQGSQLPIVRSEQLQQPLHSPGEHFQLHTPESPHHTTPHRW